MKDSTAGGWDVDDRRGEKKKNGSVHHRTKGPTTRFVGFDRISAISPSVSSFATREGEHRRGTQSFLPLLIVLTESLRIIDITPFFLSSVHSLHSSSSLL